VRVFLFSFGKLKTPGLREAADHYIRMMRSWVTLEEVELKPLKVPDKSPATRLRIQAQEGETLLDLLEGRSALRNSYLLEETGKAFNTQHWAQLIQDVQKSGGANLTFCIGSSLGFSESVRAKVKGRLSLGPQTLSHELAKTVLLEQIYRAHSVIHSHPYHNEGV